jgi:hypothetical protein
MASLEYMPSMAAATDRTSRGDSNYTQELRWEKWIIKFTLKRSINLETVELIL